MPRNLFSLAKHIRELYLRRLSEGHGVKFLLGTADTRNEVGIHCLRPEQWEIDAAADRAHAQGFEAIYIYLEW